MQCKKNFTVARQCMLLLSVVCFVNSVFGRPGNDEPEFFTSSDENFNEENIQVNVSRGVMHLLTRVDKLNAELCESKIQVARLEEQIQNHRLLEKVAEENCELKLAESRANAASQMSTLSAKQEAELNKIEKGHRAFCQGTEVTGLRRMDLSVGKYFYSGNIRRNWFGAMKFCRSRGLELLTIDNELENQVITSQIKEIGLETKDSIWTSGTDQESSRQWFWATTGKDIEFEAWHTKQPDSAVQQCVKFWNIDNKILWDDGHCSSKFKFICELPAICKL